MSKLYLRYFIAITFLNSAFLSMASYNDTKNRVVKLISIDDMKKSFRWANCYYFLEKTNIANILDEKIALKDVESRIDFYLCGYKEYLKNSRMSSDHKGLMGRMMEGYKPQILKMLLKDDPEALEVTEFHLQLFQLSRDLEKLTIELSKRSIKN